MRVPLRLKLPSFLRLVVPSIVAVFVLVSVPTHDAAATSGKVDDTGKLAFYVKLQEKSGLIKANEAYPSRYQKPKFLGQSLPTRRYKGFTLIGTKASGSDIPENDIFYAKIHQSIDLIERKSPEIYRLMRKINPRGRRVIFYTGKPGPASFIAWGKDYVVNITTSSLNKDPAFENSKYTLSATLVHELVGHGLQENDGRVWAMYDWCGKSGGKIEGIVWKPNHMGNSSGLVEYEANLFARWFLESVRGTYPNLNEVPIRRYVKIVRSMKQRFPEWYDERKSSVELLREFGHHFKKVCPGLQFTPHPVSGG